MDKIKLTRNKINQNYTLSLFIYITKDNKIMPVTDSITSSGSNVLPSSSNNAKPLETSRFRTEMWRSLTPTMVMSLPSFTRY